MQKKTKRPAPQANASDLGAQAPQKTPPDFQLKGNDKPETVIAGGFASSQARMLMLISRSRDLQMLTQNVNQHRLQLANTVAALHNQMANLDPDSPDAVRMQTQIRRINQLDRQLEMQLQRFDSQRSAIEEEREAIRRIIEENSQSIFSGMG